MFAVRREAASSEEQIERRRELGADSRGQLARSSSERPVNGQCEVRADPSGLWKIESDESNEAEKKFNEKEDDVQQQQQRP